MVELHAVGDVAPSRRDAASIFSGVARLHSADILFGQMECPLSDRGTPSPGAKLAMRTSPAVAPVLKAAGFDVMSIAGNHALDFGAIALEDTVTALADAGIATCGAGANLDAASKPALLSVGGRSIAFFAASSILPAGYAAERYRPGCMPMRAYTVYQQVELDQPGTPPRILTFADRTDLDALVSAISSARRIVDIIVVSLHWGIHFVRSEIADYQREIAHALIDAGADVILGHHPHLLKGVELYRGRPIFYSLGNFAIDQPSAFKADIHLDASFAEISALNPDFRATENYMLPEETRHTMIAICRFDADGLPVASFVPCYIDDDSRPQRSAAGSEAFASTLAYVQNISTEAGFSTNYTSSNGEVLIT